eukprot:TCONS_00068162-protein
MDNHIILLSFLILCCYACYGNTQYIARHDMTPSSYQQEFSKLHHKGYRLKQVSGYSTSQGYPRYAAIWVKNSRPNIAYKAKHGMSSKDYQEEFQKNRLLYRLVMIEGYLVKKDNKWEARYAAIWHKKTSLGANQPAYKTHHKMSSRTYQTLFNKYKTQGYRLTWVSAYTIGTKSDYYAAIWEKRSGPTMITRHRMTSSQYQSYFNVYTRRGYHLTLVDGYQLDGSERYVAIWERIGGARSARHGLIEPNYQAAFDNQKYRGYNLNIVSGYLVGSTKRYAGIWINSGIWTTQNLNHIDSTVKDFLKENQIPGGSLAITRHGKLVFAQGYGNVNTGLDASPSHLWRIASISKPITGVAIMKLIEDGQIKLSDRVFGPNGILGNEYNNGEYSARELFITVLHLLEHTAGGTTWNNKGGDGSSDPMFQHTTFSHKQLIDWVLKTREPSHWPGSIYSYSNFGYCILGRIIEKVTGVTYSEYVRTKIMEPAKSEKMHIAGNTYAQKRPMETRYYSGDGNPYTMNVHRMDSHGGWITNPIDLQRFMVHYDGLSTVDDLLKGNTILNMVKPSVRNAGKCKGGWSINALKDWWWHGGSLPGTMTVLVRLDEVRGLTWSFFVNKRGSGEVDPLMWKVVNGITAWPSAGVDLF